MTILDTTPALGGERLLEVYRAPHEVLRGQELYDLVAGNPEGLKIDLALFAYNVEHKGYDPRRPDPLTDLLDRLEGYLPAITVTIGPDSEKGSRLVANVQTRVRGA